MAAGIESSGAAGVPDQYGVAGHPVAHSWSPFIHGMFAKATAQNLSYRLFDIEPAAFRRTVLNLFAGGLRGLNVTLPHKQAAADLVNELTPRAERAHAVNTIAYFRDGKLLGENTDGIGLINDLEQNMHVELAHKRVLLLGAGGAVRGVLAPLLERELEHLVIANRTPERAINLATEFSDLGPVSGCGYDALEDRPFDLIVNGTAASLQGEMPALPAALVSADTVCYDMAYGRAETQFTTWGKSLGARHACKGWGMLVEQAAASFTLWRGIRPKTKPVLDALITHR